MQSGSLALALSLIACGSETRQPGYPQLPPPRVMIDARPPDAPADALESTARPAYGPRFGVGGPACMRAGRYQVAVDVSTARYAVRGADTREHCTTQTTALLDGPLRAMELSYINGRPVVHWRGLQVTTTVTGECELELDTGPTPIRVTFVDGRGTGTGDLAISSGCTALGVRLSIEPAP